LPWQCCDPVLKHIKSPYRENFHGAGFLRWTKYMDQLILRRLPLTTEIPYAKILQK
jgi:hypothetical protein